VEGVCCNSACGTACHSCLASKTGGANGTCAPMTNGATCGGTGGQYCNAGSCTSGCSIGGAFYPSGAGNPTNACQTCQTSSPASWSPLANGTSCGVAQVCTGNGCQIGCWIGGTLIGSGATNGTNTCQICNPLKTTSEWSNNDAATAVSCGTCGGSAACINEALGPCSKVASTYYRDADGDGYGDPNTTTSSCTSVSGYVLISGDCDDTLSYVHPGGIGECSFYQNPNAGDMYTLNTCTSNGAWSPITCPDGCVAGQCRTFSTVSVAGIVTCGSLQCPTSQGCSFVAVGSSSFSFAYATCGIGSTGDDYTACDGPNDCPTGQSCCFATAPFAIGHSACAPQGSCPSGPDMGGHASSLVCDPNAPNICPGGTTCQKSTPGQFWSLYYCQ
jgi:hypothetical protein